MQHTDQDRFKKLEWMLDETVSLFAGHKNEYYPPYGDVTELNSCRLIMDSVGKETLKKIGEYAVYLLGTSVAVYETNGDYAFGMFSSGWCKKMDAASRELCNTNDNRKALSCGKWLCHETCWNNSAKKAMETGQSTDIECVGGIHMYAEPIVAGQKIVGAINIGYGDPPKDSSRLQELSELFGIDIKELEAIGNRYKSRPEFMVDMSKNLLGAFAKMIGDIVEKTEAQKNLEKAYDREIYLNKVMKAINDVNQLIAKENDPHRLIQKTCETLVSTFGYFNAWIALVDDNNKQVFITEAAGLNGSFDVMREHLHSGCFPSCMRRTLEADDSVIITDPSAECRDCPLSKGYAGRSAFTRRLKYRDRVFGILSVSVPAIFAQGSKEQNMFIEVTRDVSFALFKIEMEKEIHLQNRIIQSIPQPMSIVSPDYRYIVVNNAYSRFFGTSRENIIGRPLTDFIEQEAFESEIKPRLDRCLKGETVQYTIRIDFPALKSRCMLMDYNPFQDRDNRIVGVITHGMDITHIKKLEKKLMHNEKRNQALVDHSPVCHKIVDLDFNLQYMSANGFKMLKLDQDAEVYGKPYPFEFFPAAFRNEMTEKMKRVKETGDTLTLEALTNDTEGNEVWLDSTLVPVLDDGKIDYLTVVSADTTQRKKDESSRKRLEQKLIQAQKSEAIGNLAGGIAHDFNNILSPVIGMSELLLEDLPEKSLEHEYALEILRAGIRGSELVKQILTFSRQSEHKMIPTRIQKIIKEVLKLSRATIPTYIEIIQDIQPDCGLAMADSIQIHQVAMNIITNAYHAVEEADGDKITVRLRETYLEAADPSGIKLEPGKYAILSVSDTGVGIPEELMDKIFDPYFTTKEPGKGTGLGLAVVYGIVQEHRGDIKIYSEIGKGTTFNVYLPLISKADKSDKKETFGTLSTGDERILLVDDEPSVAKLEKIMLERLGYSITMHTSSAEALKAFRESPDSFDMIISDMNMPNMAGNQLASEIKSIRSDIPIILCTGFSEKMNKEKADILGRTEILMKPIIRSEIAKTVRKLLDEANGKNQQE